MRPVMHTAVRTLAALAIAAIPTLALAHPQRDGAAAQQNLAAEHLTAARAALNKVLNTPAPNDDAFKKLSELKTHYMALERAASTRSPEWATHYSAIDRLLAELIGTPSASAEAGAVGTSGPAGAPAGRRLDAAMTANLQQFRTHLTAFNAAMTAAAPAPSSASAAAAAPPSSTSPPSQPEPPATTPPSDASTAAAPTGDASTLAQLDQVTALVDSALAANAQEANGKVSIDRATLEQIKTQLEQIKQQVRYPH